MNILLQDGLSCRLFYYRVILYGRKHKEEYLIMNLKELVLQNRSCRSYDETYEFSQEDLRELVNLARLSPSSGNQQALKFYISWEREEVNRICSCTHWGKDRPYPGIRCSGFVVICQDTDIDDRQWSWWREAGISAEVITLGAVEKGLAGLMIGSFEHDPLRKLLNLADHLKILLVVALGKPAEASVLEEMEPGEATASVLRDADNVTHVKKRCLDDILIPHR